MPIMPAYRVVRHVDLDAYVAAVKSRLASEPVRNNVLATLLAAQSQRALVEDDILLLAVYDLDSDELIGVALQTPPRALLMSDLPPAAATELAAWCAVHRSDLPGANGPAATADAFADAFQSRCERTASIGMRQRMFELTEVTHPSGVTGQARSATLSDRSQLIDWATAFHHEATPLQGKSDHDHLAVPIDQRLATPGLIWLWELGAAPVSMCWISAPAAGVSRISGVYTPPGHRGHGYASANVAHASEYALRNLADRCMLYTDLANPTSNKIYQAIGYRAVGDVRQWTFAGEDSLRSATPRAPRQ
jgi:predicted GNAT family acetyltransferase